MKTRMEVATAIHDALFPGGYREDAMVWPAWIFAAADAFLAGGSPNE